MEIYNMIEEYVKYERMDINSQTEYSPEDIKIKIDYLRKKIKEKVLRTMNTKELKSILYDFKLALTPSEEFMIYNRFFHLTKKDKKVIESFIDVLYFWGPDYDNEIEKINKLLEENEIEKASEMCMDIKY
ncbi:hypothetical protein [Clostridium beijerinckii]|uniref:Uncharacterized protein n=1 Tax=Clostridium beijerinckii TaxID=1520 RepID=A0AAX0B2A7_CLOBE|nr:hypothetical protein [Clostridium beijerinckii]NRT88863.1 hypothetical protein [Clostridium beijerinckii]NYC74318.1 hypothetical protein [Clostridium beijerinckii]